MYITVTCPPLLHLPLSYAGTLPTEWGNWAKTLKNLTLHNLPAVYNTIPASWGYMSGLKSLNLSDVSDRHA
jgi:hypothetical protein